MGYKLYSNITYLNPTESDRKILEKVFITRKCTQRKTLHNLKTDIFDLSDNTNITKLFSIYQKQPPRGVHRKRCSRNMQKIYRRTPMPKCNFNKVAKQLYWNRTSAWVFSCKFDAYFQNTFSQEHLWVAASETMNFLPWIKPTSVLIHLKYWYYDTLS